MIIPEPDYFPQEDHYQPIYVAIMQAYGNSVLQLPVKILLVVFSYYIKYLYLH